MNQKPERLHDKMAYKYPYFHATCGLGTTAFSMQVYIYGNM